MRIIFDLIALLAQILEYAPNHINAPYYGFYLFSMFGGFSGYYGLYNGKRKFMIICSLFCALEVIFNFLVGYNLRPKARFMSGFFMLKFFINFFTSVQMIVLAITFKKPNKEE